MDSASKKILVVDDDKDVVMLVSIHMELAGYEYITALDGKKALSAAVKHIPDAVVLDLMLPEFNGWEVCRRLKEDNRTRRVPVLILSALSDEESRSKALCAGADDFMTKPFSPKELVSRLTQLLETCRKPSPESRGGSCNDV